MNFPLLVSVVKCFKINDVSIIHTLKLQIRVFSMLPKTAPCFPLSCFPDCWKVTSVFHEFNNVGERSTSRNYYPVSLLSVVSNVFEKLVNNGIVDHLGKCGLFSDSQYGFRSS